MRKLCIFSLLVLINTIHALSLSLTRKTGQSLTDFSRRDNNGSTPIINDNDRFYNVNISLGGAIFTVELDTGSSDLWVFGDVPYTKDVSLQRMHIEYAGGTVSGSINTAGLTLDRFTVSDQAYLKADTAQVSVGGAQGILGLGPSSISLISKRYPKLKGQTPLSRIFTQSTSLERYFTIFLSRSPDVEPPISTREAGRFTLGEVMPVFKDIVNSPKLPVIADQYHSQRWEVLLDANGVIGPDGSSINTTTRISAPQSGAQTQLRVAFDSGYSLPQLPRNVVDAIYGRVPGALFYQSGSGIGLDHWNNFWTIPCDYELNISFVFANQAFPIAPLDLTLEKSDSSEDTICIARFQAMDETIIQDQGFGAVDIIFGQAFLRNTYMLVHVGDLTDDSSGGAPYIQLLSTVDRALVHTEFVVARLNGIDTTGSQPALLEQSQISTPGPAASSHSNSDISNYKRPRLMLPSTSIILIFSVYLL